MFNTGAATTNTTILISPYNTSTASQEFSISRAAVIDTANGQLIFPNTTFSFATYFNDGNNDFAGPVSYTFAVPEPGSVLLMGLSGVLLAFNRRMRSR